MKEEIKLTLGGVEYVGEVEKQEGFKEAELIRVHTEPEVFDVIGNFKYWIQNPETARSLNYDLNRVTLCTLDEANRWKTGDTLNMTTEPTLKARDIYYPEEEPEPPLPDNPWMWVKGLWVLGSGCPSSDTFADLGFNCVLRVGGGSSVDHIGIDGAGSIIFQAPPKNNREVLRKVKGYFVQDEPEIVGKTPDDVIGKLDGMHRKPENGGTKLPVGVVLTTDFHIITKNHWNERWKEVVAKCDWVGVGGCYYYRGGELNREWQDRLENSIRLIQAEGKPVIAVGQAHESRSFGATRPDMQEMDNFLRGLNCGVIWYAWNSGEESVGQTKWYDDEIRKVNRG